jgi:hypothetical protein
VRYSLYPPDRGVRLPQSMPGDGDGYRWLVGCGSLRDPIPMARCGSVLTSQNSCRCAEPRRSKKRCGTTPSNSGARGYR